MMKKFILTLCVYSILIFTYSCDTKWLAPETETTEDKIEDEKSIIYDYNLDMNVSINNIGGVIYEPSFVELNDAKFSDISVKVEPEEGISYESIAYNIIDSLDSYKSIFTTDIEGIRDVEYVRVSIPSDNVVLNSTEEIKIKATLTAKNNYTFSSNGVLSDTKEMELLLTVYSLD